MFTTNYSDFYRLNWKSNQDLAADFHEADTVWSERRSLLYKQVPQIYEYYIFIEENVTLSTESRCNVALSIKRLLDHYKPIAGTFLQTKPGPGWQFNGKLGIQHYKKAEAFTIAGFDMCVHILHRNFANVMFPVIHHGSSKCMWYAHWACHTLFPLKQLCFTSVMYSKAPRTADEDSSKEDYYTPDVVVKKFNRSTLMTPNVWNKRQAIRATNMRLLNSPDQTPSTDFVEFKLSDFSSIYDIHSKAFRSRSEKARQINPIRKNLRSTFFVHHELKCIYHLVPKAGSRTILLRLGINIPDIIKRASREGVELEQRQKIVRGKGILLSGFSRKTGELVWQRKPSLSARELEYFCFTFVRNPAERIASAYRDFFLKRKRPRELSPKFRTTWTFDQLVDYVCKTPDQKLDQHLRSQHATLNHRGGMSHLRFIGKLEDFEAGWNEFADNIGCIRADGRLNQTKRNSNSLGMNSVNYEKLRVRYAQDFKLLGYE